MNASHQRTFILDRTISWCVVAKSARVCVPVRFKRCEKGSFLVRKEAFLVVGTAFHSFQAYFGGGLSACRFQGRHPSDTNPEMGGLGPYPFSALCSFSKKERNKRKRKQKQKPLIFFLSHHFSFFSRFLRLKSGTCPVVLPTFLPLPAASLYFFIFD